VLYYNDDRLCWIGLDRIGGFENFPTRRKKGVRHSFGNALNAFPNTKALANLIAKLTAYEDRNDAVAGVLRAIAWETRRLFHVKPIIQLFNHMSPYAFFSGRQVPKVCVIAWGL